MLTSSATASTAERSAVVHTAITSSFPKITSSLNQVRSLCLIKSISNIYQGSPKQISKVADTGKKITSHFCGDCGTTLFRTGESFPGAVIIKAGILDDPEWPNKNLPKGELFAGERVKFHEAIPKAAQMEGMPPA